MGHSGLSYHRSACSTFYEHPIIASKESQRNPGNLASFGIKNARRSAGQDELVIGRRVDELLSLGPTLRLLDDDVVLGNHAIQLPSAAKRLTACGLTSR